MMNVQIQSLLETLRFMDAIDIVVVAVLLYWMHKLIRNTRAMALLKGVIVLVILNMVTHFMGLHTLSWLLQQTMSILVVALPIVFQPELRRFLEQLGSGGFLSFKSKLSKDELTQMVREVTIAARTMARKKVGALIVFERNTKLDVLSMQGTHIDGEVSSELLMNIFYPKSPLHDGAVIIRGGRIETAASLLPMSHSPLNKELGTRHRSALGQTEDSDAVVVVVSEETGYISYAYQGNLYRNVTEDTLREVLLRLLAPATTTTSSWWKWGGKA